MTYNNLKLKIYDRWNDDRLVLKFKSRDSPCSSKPDLQALIGLKVDLQYKTKHNFLSAYVSPNESPPPLQFDEILARLPQTLHLTPTAVSEALQWLRDKVHQMFLAHVQGFITSSRSPLPENLVCKVLSVLEDDELCGRVLFTLRELRWATTEAT